MSEDCSGNRGVSVVVTGAGAGVSVVDGGTPNRVSRHPAEQIRRIARIRTVHGCSIPYTIAQGI
jgi:hypothetical protein